MGRRIRRFWFFFILIIALGVRLRGITNPLLDDQAWRQADTASMATHMLGHLLNFPKVFLPQLNYDGVTPQKVELEFPFLPYLMAWTWTFFGRADIWGRLWAVALSLLTVFGIYDLARKLFSDRTGLLAAAIYAFMPLSVYYGRVVMPEPMAQAWSIWALNFAWRWRMTQRKGELWKAGFFMAGAILAKLPQLMLFPVGLIIGFWPIDQRRWAPILKYCLIALMLPMIYYGWIHFNVDKSSQFVSGILTTQVAKGWSLNWRILEKNIKWGITESILVLSVLGLFRLLFKPGFERIAFLAWSGIAILYVWVICTRIPLDYYLVPVLPLIAILSAYALELIHNIPETIFVIALLVLVNQGSYNYLSTKYLWNPAYLSQATWIRDHTPNSSVLVLSDPEPMTFYYAYRVGYRLINVIDTKDTSAQDILQPFNGDYLVRLPRSQQSSLFWVEVQKQFPEVGPGVFALKTDPTTS